MDEDRLAVITSTMAPLLDFHDPSNSRPLPQERAQRASIVPAIPRQLEKKYLRTNPKVLNSSSNPQQQQGNVHPQSVLKDSIDNHMHSPISPSGSPKNTTSEAPLDTHGNSLKAEHSYFEDTEQPLSSLQNLKQQFTPQSSTSSRDFGISKYGDRLPPSFVPSEAHRDYLSSKSTSPNEHAETTIDSAQSVGENNNPMGLQDVHVAPASERVTAFSTSNLPTISSAGYIPLQTYPSYYGYVPGQPLSFFPEPESSLNVTPSPTASAYQGYGHVPYVPALPSQDSYPDGNAGLYDAYQPSHSNTYSQPPVYDSSHDYYGYSTNLQAVPGQLPFTPAITPFNRITTFQPPVESIGSQSYHRRSSSTRSTMPEPVHPGGNSSVQKRLSPDTPDHVYKDGMQPPNTSPKMTEQPPAYTEGHLPQAKTSLLAHLQAQFDDPIYADSRLQVYIRSNSAIAEYYVHTLLIVQSPLLKNLVDESRLGAGNGILSLHLNDRFATKSTVEAALRVCYGESASNLRASSGNLDKEDMSPDPSSTLMDTALAYIATGSRFELPDLALRGVELASENLDYGNVQSALLLAFHGGLGTEWLGDPQASREQEEYERTFMCSSETDSEDGMSSIGELREEHWAASKAPSGPTYNPYANQLLHRCLFLISSWASGDWKLDKSAPPVPYMDRLPVTAETKPSSTKARLGSIKFGDFCCGHATDNHKSTLSSILLCIPYQLLQHVLEVLVDKSSLPKQKANIVELVKERELRRQCVLRSESVSLAKREEEFKNWEPVGWHEKVEFPSAPNGVSCKLTRKWIGLKNPIGC